MDMSNKLLNELKDLKIHLDIADGQLRIIAPQNGISEHLIRKIRDSKDSLTNAIQKSKMGRPKSLILTGGCVDGWNPLSPSQKRIWALDTYNNDTAFNSFRVWKINGDVNVDHLRKAIQLLTSQHPALRLKVRLNNGVLEQAIENNAPVDIEFSSLSGLGLSEKDIPSFALEVANTKIPLDEGSLIRARVIEIDPRCHVLIIVVHQFVYDGTSINTLVDDFSEYLSKLRSGETIEIYKDKHQYVSFSSAIDDLLDPAEVERQRSFWQDVHKTKFDLLNLPLVRGSDIKSESNQTRKIVRYVDSSLYQKLREYSKKQQKSFYLLCLASAKVLVSLLTGQSDILFYSYISLRDKPEFDRTVGLFTNILLTRISVDRCHSFQEILKDVSDKVLSFFNHKHYGLADQFECLKINHVYSEFNPYQICFVGINVEKSQMRVDGLLIEEVAVDRPALFDILFHVTERKNDVEVFLEYRASQFTEEQMKYMLDSYFVLLNCILDYSSESISKMLEGAEIHPMLSES